MNSELVRAIQHELVGSILINSISRFSNVDEQRTLLVEMGLIGSISSSLPRCIEQVGDDPDSQRLATESFRVIGNLCFDHSRSCCVS
jgi:hypothetical protein